jgi:hypothetical protein
MNMHLPPPPPPPPANYLSSYGSEYGNSKGIAQDKINLAARESVNRILIGMAQTN